MAEPSFQNAIGKISEGLVEGVGCVLISTIQGVKHLAVAIKGKPPTQQEPLEEWQLVHKMEMGEISDGAVSHLHKMEMREISDGAVSHAIWIMD